LSPSRWYEQLIRQDAAQPQAQVADRCCRPQGRLDAFLMALSKELTTIEPLIL